MFLFLSAMTALLECGPIFLGISLGYGPGQILSFCLAYQFGNLFPVPFHLCKKMLISAAYFFPVLLCLAGFSSKYSLFQWLFYLMAIMLLSCVTQSIRSVAKSQTGTVPKRIARVVGFFLSPTMAYAPTLLMLVCWLTVIFSFKDIQRDVADTNCFTIPCKTMRKNYCYHIMLWHQLHYFIYAYAMILFIYQTTNRSFLTMILFACTWLTYLLTEPLINYLNLSHPQFVDKFCTKSRNIVTILIGHTFLLLILLLLPYAKSAFLIVLWILTGFGGGTVFAITALCKQSVSYRKEHLEITENIGHFAGTALAVIWALFFPKSIQYLSCISALCVIMVLLLTLKNMNTVKKEVSYENSNCRK